MIRCVHPRGSRTTKWLTTINRGHTTTKSISEQGNTSNWNAPTSVSVASSEGISDGSDLGEGIGRLEGIKYGTTPTAEPYKRRDLPISPLMDPEVIAAREKHKVPKLPPTTTPTLFQQQLAKNPYAQALATPVRQCQITDTRLPKYFLQDFELMAHPETREPWWVPTSLRKKRRDGESLAGKEEAGSVIPDQDSELPSQAEEFDGDIDPANTNGSLLVDTATPSSSVKVPRSAHPSLGPGVYTLSRQALLMAMKNPKSGWNMPAWKYFSNGFFKTSAIARKVRDGASWRMDMENFILELMRRRVVEGLEYLVKRKRGYVAGCVGWEDAKISGRQQGVILWTGKKIDTVGEQSFSAEDAVDGKAELAAEDGSTTHYPGRDDPPGFATLTIGKDKPRMVPVHNLPMLLGPEHLERLRKKCPIFNKEVLIVRDRNVTVDIQVRLWNLQGYLAFPEIHDGKRRSEPERRGLIREDDAQAPRNAVFRD